MENSAKVDVVDGDFDVDVNLAFQLGVDTLCPLGRVNHLTVLIVKVGGGRGEVSRKRMYREKWKTNDGGEITSPFSFSSPFSG